MCPARKTQSKFITRKPGFLYSPAVSYFEDILSMDLCTNGNGLSRLEGSSPSH